MGSTHFHLSLLSEVSDQSTSEHSSTILNLLSLSLGEPDFSMQLVLRLFLACLASSILSFKNLKVYLQSEFYALCVLKRTFKGPAF